MNDYEYTLGIKLCELYQRVLNLGLAIDTQTGTADYEYINNEILDILSEGNAYEKEVSRFNEYLHEEFIG